jgi:hypothetical protein
LFRKKVAYRVPFRGVEITISCKFDKLKDLWAIGNGRGAMGDGIEAIGEGLEAMGYGLWAIGYGLYMRFCLCPIAYSLCPIAPVPCPIAFIKYNRLNYCFCFHRWKRYPVMS